MNKMIFPVITENEVKLPFYLVGVGCYWEQEHIVRPDGYPNFQWIQCHKGEGELVIKNTIYPIRENQGMLLYPHEPHEYYSVTEDWQVDWIIFDGYQLREFLNSIRICKTQVCYISQPDLLLTKIRNVLNVATSGVTMCSLDCSILVYDLLINLSKYTSVEETDNMLLRYSKLKPVLDYIGSHYAKQLTLCELSEVIGVSPQHLCVLFREILNSRVFEYINHIRIQKSKEFILTHRNLQIKEIAVLSGFTDFSYFCSVFRKVEKTNPGGFKKLYGK